VSEQSGTDHGGQEQGRHEEPLNEEGAGLGMDDEPNTFEPEEEPEATEEPEDE
jgi:hypothetical protein